MPDIESGKIKLSLFASKSTNAVAVLRSRNLTGYLYNPKSIQCIGNKIPTFLKYAYNIYAETVDDDKTDLEKLADFLYREAERTVTGRIFDVEVNTEIKKTPTDKRPTSDAKAAKVYTSTHLENDNTTPEDLTSSALCMFCSRINHKSPNCLTFARDSLERRWYLVRKYRLCYKCLEQGHLMINCESGNCAQYSRPHHVLLHDPGRSRFQNKNRNKNKYFQQGNAETSQLAVPQFTGINNTPKTMQ